MKQALHMKMGQTLAMTPQLQQAIKLLQLSTLELQTEIQSALECNPMLEMQDEDGSEPHASDMQNEPASEAREQKRAEEKQLEAATAGDDDDGRDSVPDSLPDTMPDGLGDDVPVDGGGGGLGGGRHLRIRHACHLAGQRQRQRWRTSRLHRIPQRRCQQHPGSPERADPLRAAVRA